MDELIRYLMREEDAYQLEERFKADPSLIFSVEEELVGRLMGRGRSMKR